MTRKDYLDQNQKLATFVQAFQNSKHVQEILDRDFGQGLWFEGWKEGEKEWSALVLMWIFPSHISKVVT